MNVQPEFGYVILSGVANWCLYTYLGHRVGKARKKYGIKYPKMYADGAEAETENGRMFNCIQRGHQNMLEFLPPFYFFLTVTGLQYPIFASTCGLIFFVGRMLYARGYSTGDPSKRLQGFPGALALLGLAGGAVYSAIELLRS